MIKELTELNSISILSIILIGTSTVCMGVGGIFLFNRDLFFILSEWKLILLSTSFSTPVWFVNFLVINLLKRLYDVKSGNLKSLTILTSIMTILEIATIYVLKIFL